MEWCDIPCPAIDIYMVWRRATPPGSVSQPGTFHFAGDSLLSATFQEGGLSGPRQRSTPGQALHPHLYVAQRVNALWRDVKSSRHRGARLDERVLCTYPSLSLALPCT